MVNWLRSVCLSLLLLGPGFLRSQVLEVEGPCLSYTPALQKVLGLGPMTLKMGSLTLKGRVLVLDIPARRGRLLGEVQLERPGGLALLQGQDLRFALEPLVWELRDGEGAVVARTGEGEMAPLAVPTPGEMRQADLIYLCSGLRLRAGGKLIGLGVLPEVLGVPSMPLRRLALRRTETKGRNLLYLERLGYTRQRGLQLDMALGLDAGRWKGGTHLQLFERALWGLPGRPRGLALNADGRLLPAGEAQEGRPELLTYSLQGDSETESFHLSLGRTVRLGRMALRLSPQLWLQEGQEPRWLMGAQWNWNPQGPLGLTLDLGNDLNGYHQERAAFHFRVGRHWSGDTGLEWTRAHAGWARKETRLWGNLSYTASLLTVNGNWEEVLDHLAQTRRHTLSLHGNLVRLELLEGHWGFLFSPFYRFSAFPTPGETRVDQSVGFGANLSLSGIALPLGLSLDLASDLTQTWEQEGPGSSRFSHRATLSRTWGYLVLGLELQRDLTCHLKGFWVEGYHLGAVRLKADWNPAGGSLTVRLHGNGRGHLEQISGQGFWRLPLRANLQGFGLWDLRQKRLQAMELAVEKVFLRSFRLRGGYSFVWKRFFIELAPCF